jgi:16S rRNA (guanine1207-N2)-methyltransferase
MSNPDRLALPFEKDLLPAPDGPALFLGAETGAILDEIGANNLICSQSLRPTFDQLTRAGAEMIDAPKGVFSLTLMCHPRNRTHALGRFAQAWAHTQTDGQIVVSGSKGDGIDSTRKLIAQNINIDGSLAKSHGKAFWLTKTNATPECIAAWTDAAKLTKNADGYLTDPSMFSWQSIDTGSRTLLPALTGKIAGTCADFGAGWGYLSDQLLKIAPKIDTLDVIEAEKTALEAAKQNISDPRARYHWADVTTLPRKRLYDTIIMNPPFHQSRSADISLGQSFIETAAACLKPNGTLLMVANRHLPYERTLSERFKKIVEPIGGTPAFKIISASRPTK